MLFLIKYESDWSLLSCFNQTSKFKSRCLHFPNNLIEIKDHIQTYTISFKIFFQLMVTVFKENELLATPFILQ